MVFGSLSSKLLVLMIALSLLPLVGISIFSYYVGSKQIAEDRIKLVLENKAQDTADKIDIMLRNQKQEVASMATTLSVIRLPLGEQNRESMIELLNNFCVNHEVYDVLAVLDDRGKIVAVNTVNRFDQRLPSLGYLGADISGYPGEKELFARSVRGESSHQDWYQSTLVQRLYDYRNEDESHRWNIAYSEPVRNPQTHEIIGVWISIINWYYIQSILDSVEPDLANQGLKTGYAFMYAKDADRIIGHKYRANRSDIEPLPSYPPDAQNLYNTRIIENHGLRNVHDAIKLQMRSFAYEFPAGNKKISGFAPIDDTSFGWIVGVGVDETDIFRPIQKLRWWLVGMTFLLGILVVISTFVVARGITVPLRNLIHSSQTIAQGNLSQRVLIRSSDEIGILGVTFNDMARAL
ncbi:MAG: HAMP domain-containing protein, partial [Acidobacteriota bacterium]